MRARREKDFYAPRHPPGDRVNEAACLNDLGLLAKDLGQWDEALAWYGQALSIFEELNQRGNQGIVWYNVGDATRSATVCTRPAERPLRPLIALHSTGPTW